MTAKTSADTQENLNQSKKVKIIIAPVDDPNDLIVPVCINNEVYRIERGKEVEVPDYVLEVLSVKRDMIKLLGGKRTVHQVPAYPFTNVS